MLNYKTKEGLKPELRTDLSITKTLNAPKQIHNYKIHYSICQLHLQDTPIVFPEVIAPPLQQSNTALVHPAYCTCLNCQA